jgi:gluconate 2-dehydrogenase gamma chain
LEDSRYAAEEENFMGNDGEGLTRRELLLTAGMVVSAAVVPVLAQTPAPKVEEPLKTLTRLEYDTLDAICSRIIPSDENGPGAKEAKAARFIDWGLAGSLGGRGGAAGMRDLYTAGLAAVESYAMSFQRVSFADLTAAEQDAIINDLSQNRVPQAPQNFFNMVRTHTIQGTFSDPFYGGNANFVGWDMIGYPGARVQVDANLQRMDRKPAPSHKSAYDYGMFSKGEL